MTKVYSYNMDRHAFRKVLPLLILLNRLGITKRGGYKEYSAFIGSHTKVEFEI